ncbi:choice-of-anchor M domain-containing protein [Corynebacterium epidermidicanis]|uniref:Actinobacterial surface-anchored protein domain n=1 Tax=Corynebacterium epidermidicanis TaxID=1050174 RepID=A0A0G3GU73_9CORY|nr:choice-of-anchor M domain-containing protein [Corynebacterium epidermidicanis]AKK04100.1 actinobacterial surface-anchored protein domain [Corynebacterium epidermidicanis]
MSRVRRLAAWATAASLACCASPVISTPMVPAFAASSTTQSSANNANIAGQVKQILSATNPSTIIRSGHQDMALIGNSDSPQVLMRNDDDQQEYSSGSFAYAVADSALIPDPLDIPELHSSTDGQVWLLPQTQDENLPWQGFSTESFDYGSLGAEGVRVRISEFAGPGQMLSAHQNLGSLTVNLDSSDPSSSLHYPATAHDHMNFFFTAPGAYRVTYRFSATGISGASLEQDLVAYYLVGDEAIVAAADVMAAGGATHSDPGAERIGLLLGGGMLAWKVAQLLGNHSEPKPENPKVESPAGKMKATAETPSASGSPSRVQVQQDSKPVAGSDPAEATQPAGGAPGAPTAGPRSSGAQQAAGAKPAQGTTAGKTQAEGQKKAVKGASTSTPKPAPKGSIPDATTQPLAAVAPQPEPARASSDVAPASLTEQLTAGGWLAGFVLGIGVMALLGGLGLFIATAVTLRRFPRPADESVSDDPAADEVS